ncbi:MAG: hypothetical protein WCL23_04515 [Candidatus Moraniibacteriota bacterium]
MKQKLLLRRLEQLSSGWLEFEIKEIDIIPRFDNRFPDGVVTFKNNKELLSAMVLEVIFQVDVTDELHYKENSEKIKEMMSSVRNLETVTTARLGM